MMLMVTCFAEESHLLLRMEGRVTPEKIKEVEQHLKQQCPYVEKVSFGSIVVLIKLSKIPESERSVSEISNVMIQSLSEYVKDTHLGESELIYWRKSKDNLYIASIDVSLYCLNDQKFN